MPTLAGWCDVEKYTTRLPGTAEIAVGELVLSAAQKSVHRRSEEHLLPRKQSLLGEINGLQNLQSSEEGGIVERWFSVVRCESEKCCYMPPRERWLC